MSDVLLEGFKRKVYALFSAADPVNQLPSRDIYIHFMSPGLPLTSADLDFSLTTGASARAAASFARLSNTLPSTWSSPDTPLWVLYQQVLQQSVLAQNQLSPAEADRLNAARNKLVQYKTVNTTAGAVESIVETAQYALYKQLMAAYERARLKYNNLKITAQFSTDPKDQALWEVNEPVYRQALSRYYGDWVARGDKNDIEAAIQFIDQVTGRGAGLRWKSLKDDFSISQRSAPNGSTYYDTQLQPSNIFKLSTKDWLNVTCQSAEALKLQSNTPEQAQGSDRPGGSTIQAQSMSADLAQAFLVRPWFDASVLSSRAWKWSDDSGLSQLLSSGQWPPPAAPAGAAGLMPVYPVSVLFARNLKLSQVSTTTTSADAGPFSLANSHQQGTVLQSDDVQIIGFICAKTPLSPDPDPQLQWLQ